MQHFDPVATPLHGVNLIEASAGTGKTYTIATLVVRLVLENRLDIRNILVVTFTEAATAELRERVRARLEQTRRAFSEGESDDAVLARLLEAHPEQREQAVERLTNALRGFDEAAIFTIHGFCQRMLQENAFESGILFDTELLADQSDLLREIATDFWRRALYPASPLFIQYALGQGFTPSALAALLNAYLGRPFLQLLPTAESPSATLSNACEAAYQAAYEAVRQAWPQAEAEVLKIFLGGALKKTSYSDKSVAIAVAGMRRLADSEVLEHNLPDRFELFLSAKMKKALKKGAELPKHAFFDLCADLKRAELSLQSVYQEQLIQLKRHLFDDARARLERRKRELNIQGFDDLLSRLYRVLHGGGGARLAQRIQERYRAALIDEFQDTDGLQYAIFRQVYVARPDSVLFFIGDPKQAIYSFRGADIFTYLSAAHDARRQYTLASNWRSAPNLVQALNALWRHPQQAFLLPGLEFYPVKAEKDKNPLADAPLRLQYLSRKLLKSDKKVKFISKEWGQYYLPVLVAEDIVRLLHEEPTLQAGDIAVLVRKNSQAVLMQRALQRARVPAVLYSPESLFASAEAQALERILAAVLEPGDENRLRAALCTDLIGLDGGELFRLHEDEQAWEQWLNRFYHYHRLWRQQDFMRMFRALLLELQVAERLLRFADGERRLTNVLHLAEVLQQASLAPRRGMLPLYHWLRERVAAPDLDGAYELRLESDARAVKLVTIHKSKGLEYPVVFLPFAWESEVRANSAEQFTFHDEAEPPGLFLDLGSEARDAHRDKAVFEEKAESLRLLYVALTRAKYRCYVYWGAFNGAEQSALCHLLHPRPEQQGKWLEQTEDSELLYQLHSLADAADDTLSVEEVSLPEHYPRYRPPQAATQDLRARDFTARLGDDWRITSFSALTRQTHNPQQRAWLETVECAEHDAIADRPAPPAPRPGGEPDYANPFALPAGAQTGNLLHELLEELDFQAAPEARQALIEAKLAAYAYAPEWIEAINVLLDKALQTPLDAAVPGLSLAAIPRQARLNELEFFYPLHEKLDFAAFATLLQQYGYPELAASGGWEPMRGFVKGSIDLVFQYQEKFYLLDYKSNYLGDSAAHYGEEALRETMHLHRYRLQYVLYSFALHRYLGERLPDYDYERDFGGVYYLFLRGMDAAGRGIYRDRPPQALLQALGERWFNAA